MKTVKVALIMIVKASDDEADHLQRCLESVGPYVDGVFLNINAAEGAAVPTRLMEVVKAFQEDSAPALKHRLTIWHDNFAEARNISLDMVPPDYDWVLWLDTDDTVDNPKKIREVAEASANFDCVYVDYEYDHDEFGNVTTVHMVGRLFKNNGSHRWNEKTRIHETLVETRSINQGMTKDFKVVHHADAARKDRSFERNIKMLEAQLDAEKDDPDPRTLYYLANAYLDAGNTEAAKHYFSDYLDMSGWDQERSAALTKLARIYLDDGDVTEARYTFSKAIAEDPTDPTPRVELGSLELSVNNQNRARVHLEYVANMEKDQTTLERNPLTYTYRTYLLLAQCYLDMGGKWLPKAAEYARKAVPFRKKDHQLRDFVKMVEKVHANKELTEHYLHVYKSLRKGREYAKSKKLLELAPKEIDDNPIVVKLRDEGKPFKWPEKSIVFMTGATAQPSWGPWSLEEGIGGSEEAIIRLAPKFAAMGYRVVVFGSPGHLAGLDGKTGVMWRNFWEWNPDDEYDIFVAWRAPHIFDRKIKARKSYLWLHDVMEPGEFTKRRIANFTKCIVLSEYHRSLFPMIPDEKILLSANGVDPEEFDDLAADKEIDERADKRMADTKRDPHKVFYGSSHVRGLAYLYEIWPEVKATVPDATLDVYYGRGSYDAVHKGNPERMKWMDDMIAKAKVLDGVTDHGKVGQDEIVRHMFESGVWAYPCPFPEIYCITAVKAQAAGCVPVSTNFAALDETVQFGTKIDIPHDGKVGRADKEFLEKYKVALIDMLQHPEKQQALRGDMMAWARTKSWQAVAEQWEEEFKK